MKKTFRYSWSVLALSLLLIVTGCKKDPTPGGEDPIDKPVVTLSVSPTSLSLPGMGGESVITVSTNADDWSVSTEASWLTVAKESATAARLSAAANADFDRNAVVRFQAGVMTASVSVSQGKIAAAQIDSVSLVALYNATGGASAWTDKWTLTAPLSQWTGVTVENGRVVELKLPSNGLTGALPAGFSNLTQLRYVDLSGNSLSGALPAGLNNLTEVYFLDLSANQFSGAAPGLGALTKLVMLDLSDNQLTALPALSDGLPALEYLAASGNLLTGALPEGWGSYTELRYVDVSKNELTGSVPAPWSALTKLQVFYLYKNKLSDSIPAYITTFTGLESLALNHNDFTKNIPAGLGSLPKLEELWLAQNKLTGSIPASLLGNAHWAAWQSGVCPQQSGFGFDNCTASSSTSVAPLSVPLKQRAFKARYQR